jgi:molybdenum cofactor cytidylyltransferase
MIFGSVPIADAQGGIAAHSIRHGALVIRKGTLIGPQEIASLRDNGVERIVIARPGPDDIGEDEAAALLAARLAGSGVRVDHARTGRANLFAAHGGLLRIDRNLIDRFNHVDEALTVATLPAFKPVAAGEMIGTVKIIPFAVSRALVESTIGETGEGPIVVAPFRPLNVAVVSTLLPGLKPSVVRKTADVLQARLDPAGARILSHQQVAHAEEALAEALAALRASEAELIVVFGASAITDRRDVIPAALERAGGRIEQFGMPVDPGNLLLLGALGPVPVLGAPGCARSPKENGFDWVLQRILADIPVTRADIMGMGVGGLLMEIVLRGQLRDPGQRDDP